MTFKIKWPQSEKKLKFGDRLVCGFLNPPPPPRQNFVVTPLTTDNSRCYISPITGVRVMSGLLLFSLTPLLSTSGIRRRYPINAPD